MTHVNFRFYVILLVCLLITQGSMAQNSVPAGINYQAVARDRFGKELVNSTIDVRFTIISQNPLGPVAYQELHSAVVTSKYGVFSLIIGKGTATGGMYPDILKVQWADSPHYLKVEVKIENGFIDMGTMQFLSVPYALFASRSLEPGPPGPKGDQGPQGLQGAKGDPGDPASDKQTLSVINADGADYLAISGGNQVKISNIEKDGDPFNEIQDLTINSDKLKITKNPGAMEWDLSPYRQNLVYDPATRIIGITGSSSSVNLSELKNDDDASPTNEIQSLSFNTSNNTLSLSNSPSVDLSSLKDDADASPTNEIQSLSLAADNLSISGSNSVSLTQYKDNTDNQSLTYSETSGTKSLQISGGNSVTIGSMVAFRAKNVSSDPASSMSYHTMTYDAPDYNIGGHLNPGSGIFTVPQDGIYTFNVTYFADGTGGSRELAIYVNSVLYDKLAIDIGSGFTIPVHSVTMKLSTSNTVSIVIYTGVATQTGTGSFSGFRVY